MAPSAISTPNEAQDEIWPHSNGSLDIHAQLENLGLSSPLSYTNGHASTSSIHAQQSPDAPLDLICIGFGPASLAVAIALHDTYASSSSSLPPPKVLFLEKQPQFAWHAGMQLPGAKMQISFLKDLATPRDPTSKFTFLNYLFSVGRLNHFINLGTFLPSRVEYEDYLRWCAGHFEREGKVAYAMEAEGVRVGQQGKDGKVESFAVTARAAGGEMVTRKAKRVVIAVGGRPVIPRNLQGLKHVFHSSQFANSIGSIQGKGKEVGRPLRFAVVGSGQSAAEIFNDLWERFPDARIRLIIKGSSLRPSDDSPFVNEVFDPDRVDSIYSQHSSERAAAISLDRGTNYGVVRLTLLEHLYDKLYMQRVANPNESRWRCQILSNRAVISATQSKDSSVKLKLGVPEEMKEWLSVEDEEFEVDYLFTATGYVRNAHEEMLQSVGDLLPEELKKEGKFPVSRYYRVLYDEDKVDSSKAGVWLQGCNEVTHGLSDTLLSILAVRGGELVRSMFGAERP